MRYYSRLEIVELLEIEADFLEELEQEEIIQRDAPPEAAGEFSGRMLERVRVASNLVHDLEVNLPGAAIIIRLREEISGMQHQIEDLLKHTRGRFTER
ncbi:MAG: chaperone modulator CbpM [Myxococcota bacterium]